MMFSSTLIERKSRMPPHVRGIKGEAVVVYCEPLITKKMGHPRLSRRVNKTDIKLQNSYLTGGRDIKIVQIIGLLIEIRTL
jgi:hypothetical protein